MQLSSTVCITVAIQQVVSVISKVRFDRVVCWYANSWDWYWYCSSTRRWRCCASCKGWARDDEARRHDRPPEFGKIGPTKSTDLWWNNK